MKASEVVRMARSEARMTVRQLAGASGVPAARISDYENDRHQPSFAMVQRLLAPTGFTLVVQRPLRIDPERNGRIFADVLSVVDSIPFDELHRRSHRIRPSPPTWAQIVGRRAIPT